MPWRATHWPVVHVQQLPWQRHTGSPVVDVLIYALTGHVTWYRTRPCLATCSDTSQRKLHKVNFGGFLNFPLSKISIWDVSICVSSLPYKSQVWWGRDCQDGDNWDQMSRFCIFNFHSRQIIGRFLGKAKQEVVLKLAGVIGQEVGVCLFPGIYCDPSFHRCYLHYDDISYNRLPMAISLRIKRNFEINICSTPTNISCRLSH